MAGSPLTIPVNQSAERRPPPYTPSGSSSCPMPGVESNLLLESAVSKAARGAHPLKSSDSQKFLKNLEKALYFLGHMVYSCGRTE